MKLNERDALRSFPTAFQPSIQLNAYLQRRSMNHLAEFAPLLGYVPREYIASGGQSSIYRALHTAKQTFAALKVVPFPLQQQAELEAKAKQLVREMRIHETLKHKNILQLFGGETRQAVKVKHVEWPMGLYMILDLGQSRVLTVFPQCVPPNGPR